MSDALCSVGCWWDPQVVLGVGRPLPVNGNEVSQELCVPLGACSWRAAPPWVLLASIALGLQWI